MKPEEENPQELKMQLPLLTNKFRTPTVYWYQTDNKIVLRIMLANVNKYFLFVDFDHIRYSTIHEDKSYYLCLYFFGAIIPGKIINLNLEREIRIHIPKAHKFLQWPRLQYHRSKPPQIMADPEKYDDIKLVFNTEDVFEASWDGLQENKEPREALMPAGFWSSDDDDESDDERDNILYD
ncbi:uncharacterized protein [Chelonus insularis]|uniref:uncharacterized protein n=1 Tax=Chelonus insularis TaxID=460826 RepID=UPI00158878A2|nr:uncharacterized protein LOC118074109 [Chelonus insularis]